MEGSEPSPRPRLLLYTARYQFAQKNAIAATLAWVAERRGFAFDVYYDAIHSGLHFGGGNPEHFDLGVLTGGLVTGGRHLEAAAQALQRFEATVICSGRVALGSTFATLAESSNAAVYVMSEDAVVSLYDKVFSSLEVDWPDTAVMLSRSPGPGLDGIDAYCYPEILFRGAVGIEATISLGSLAELRTRGITQMVVCGVHQEQQEALTAMGFQVRDHAVIVNGDDYRTATYRLAQRWRDQQRGWIIGDPVLVSYSIPVACRERRTAIFSVPPSAVIGQLENEIAEGTQPILGRQFEDADFFTLSELGQSFQLIDPCRPAFPVLQTLPADWSDAPDPREADPSDEELLDYFRQGRVLCSLVFWSGMIRETENMYALMDLFALTGLRAGIALTAQSLAWRPSPLDLLAVPRSQGGVFPNIEVLLASCGTGAAIESLLEPQRLRLHLADAGERLTQLNLPRGWMPEGWWATMDAPMVPLDEPRSPRLEWRGSKPRLRVRYRGQRAIAPTATMQDVDGFSETHRGQDLRSLVREAVRRSSLNTFFEAYRPFEHFAPGRLAPELAEVVKEAGFSYMLSKSGFNQPPHIVYRDEDFVALNYTAGQWDGWTPFETINGVDDLRRAEKALLAGRKPGWLLGSIDSCLWAFSGELWRKAPGLAAIANYVASGGTSRRLINVRPVVLARYARICAGEGQSADALPLHTGSVPPVVDSGVSH